MNTCFNRVLFRTVQSYDYIEDHAEAQVSPRLRRKIDFNVRLRAHPAGNAPLRTECRVPAQNYIRERFPDSRNGETFKLLRAENQRRLNLCVARGNVQLSRTSGDWHPITPSEIAAILAAEAEAKLKMYPNEEPKDGPTPKRIESDFLRHRKIHTPPRKAR